MAAGGPARPHTDETSVIHISDIDIPLLDIRTLDLGVAPQAKVDVPLGQQLEVDGSMHAVANGTALAQRWMLEDKWTRLFSVTLRASLIGASHGKPSGRFEYVSPMWVVTLDAVHFPFEDRMVLGQMELGLDLPMTFEAAGWIFAGVDNEFSPSATAGDVETSGAMAGFATRLACGAGVLETDARVSTPLEKARDVGMAFGAASVAHKACAGNFRR